MQKSIDIYQQGLAVISENFVRRYHKASVNQLNPTTGCRNPIPNRTLTLTHMHKCRMLVVRKLICPLVIC